MKNLWIPIEPGNRIATIDLSHIRGNEKDSKCFFHGWNANCMTEYVIVPVPSNFEESDIKRIAQEIYGPLATAAWLSGDVAQEVYVRANAPELVDLVTSQSPELVFFTETGEVFLGQKWPMLAAYVRTNPSSKLNIWLIDNFQRPDHAKA